MGSFRGKARVVGYVASGVVAGVALVLSCSDSMPKSQAQTAGGGGGTGVTCSPGSSFCNGNTLWQCNLAGTDGSAPLDCSSQGSTANPSTCQASGCPEDAGSCCLRASPTCAWTVTAPVMSSGQTGHPLTVADEQGSYCAPPTPIGPCGGGTFAVQFGDASVCPAVGIDLYMTRGSGASGSGTVAPGILNLPTAGVSLVTTGCSSWTGTIDWVSDVPNWKVQINATCCEQH